MSATIKDVAELAGVSAATVSNYLNHTKPVSRAVSERIRDAVEKLHYMPNQSARSLRSSSYTDIGVILPNFDDPYYVQIFQGIETEFYGSGYYANLAFSHNISSIETNLVQDFLRKQIRGLILISSSPDNWKFYHRHFKSPERPLVLIDRDIRSLDANFISCDYYKMTRALTEAVLRTGRKNLLLVCGLKAYSCETQSIRGFTEAVRSFRIRPGGYSILPIDLTNTKEDAFRCALQHLHNRKPQAIIATSDLIANGCAEALEVLGIRPDDMPVYALSEEHWNRTAHTYTAGFAPRQAMRVGRTASRMLFEQLEAPHTKENERLLIGDVSVVQIPRPASVRPSVAEKTAKEELPPLRILLLDTPQAHALTDFLPDFENSTGIRTEVKMLPHPELYDAIRRNHTSPGGKPFDVIMYDIPWLTTLAAEGILLDFTDRMRDFDPSVFLEESLPYFSLFEDRWYGVPFMYGPQLFFYRKDLFEDFSLREAYEKKNHISLRPPLTLKEFVTIADFFTNSTDRIPYGISVPAKYSECLTPELYMRLHAFGASVFDREGNVTLEGSGTLKAYINLLQTLAVAKPDYRSTNDYDAVQDFLTGKTAMLLSYTSFLLDQEYYRRFSLKETIGISLVPGRAPLLGGWSLGISTRSTRSGDAFSFLQWICREQTANYLTVLGGNSVLRSTYTNDELVKLFPWLPVLYSTQRYCSPILPPVLPNGIVPDQQRISSVFTRYLFDLFDKKIEIPEAIAMTRRDLEEMIAEYGKKRS